MFCSSEVSQAFYTVISLHFAVVACLPSRPLYTCVSPSPGTCNSCHNVLPVLLKILRVPAKPTALILSLPVSALLPKTPHPILQQDVLCSLPLLLFLHPNLLHFSALSWLPLSAQRSCQQEEPLIAISSPAQPVVADALVDIRDSARRGTSRISQRRASLQLESAINCEMHFHRERSFGRSRIVTLFLLLNSRSLDT